MKSVINLLFAAYTGDMSALRRYKAFYSFNASVSIVFLITLFIICVIRFALSSIDMEQRDYDSRTALHVAAAEGKTSQSCYFIII